MDQNETKVEMHPFERTLGQGPYRFVGFFEINIQAGQMGRPYINQYLVHPKFKTGAGTCAHCGHAILNIFQVQIGNGDVYGVGSDCIAKAGLPARELSLVKRAELKHQRELRAARKQRNGEKARLEVRQLLESRSEALRAIPSPGRGVGTLFDYAQWCVSKSNAGGIVIVLKRIKALLENSGNKA